jgi:hypothetical protein
MTLLTICRDAADEIGIDRPSSVISNPQPHVQKLARYANKAGKQLMKNVAWQVLRKERTFSALGQETQTSILPSDFDRLVTETFWNRTAQRLIDGPVSATEWQSLKAFSYAGDPKFAYRGDSILIIPVPSAGQTLAFEYVSENWCQSSGGTAQSAWAADDDTGIIDEELITRAVKYLYLTDEGLPNGGAAAELESYLNDLVQSDQPGASVMVAADIFGGARHFAGAPATSGGFNMNVL